MKMPDVGDVMIKYDHEWFPDECPQPLYRFRTVSDMMEEYGRKMWNAALDWAAEHVEIRVTTVYMEEFDGEIYHHNIDKESILKGKL